MSSKIELTEVKTKTLLELGDIVKCKANVGNMVAGKNYYVIEVVPVKGEETFLVVDQGSKIVPNILIWNENFVRAGNVYENVPRFFLRLRD